MRDPRSQIPVQLQQQGVTAAGTAMLARGWMGCKDRDIKADLLHTMWVLPAAKAVARPGDPYKWENGASELLMGAMSGVDRSTMCRRLAKFSNTVCGRCYGSGKVKSGVRSQELEDGKESGMVEASTHETDTGLQRGVRTPAPQHTGNSVHHSQEARKGVVRGRKNDNRPAHELITCPKCNGGGTREAEVVELLHKWRPGIGCVNHYSYVEQATGKGKATGNRQQATGGQDGKTAVDMAPEVAGDRTQLHRSHPEKSAKNGGESPNKKPAGKSDHPLNEFNPAKLAARYGEDLFDKGAEGLNGCFECELWIWDPNIKKTLRCGCRKGQMTLNFSSDCTKCGGHGFTFHPTDKMGENPRKVLAILRAKGLGSVFEDEHGGKKLKEYVELTCAEIGELAGLCENTVAACLDEWEDHKVLQIAPGKVVYEDFNDPKTGLPAIKCRLPQRIIWLPGLLLDPAMIEREQKRYAAYKAACQEKARLNGWANAGIHLQRIDALHAELLRRWSMSRHSLGAFWRAMRKLIYREGIPSGQKEGGRDGRTYVDYRNELFPISLYQKLE